ncbi:ATP-binding protein [Sedimenticola selenatireducens]|nr:ATP-binding protein [Sedimenticola selenatireducens]
MSSPISIRKRLLITLIGLIGVTWLGVFVLISKDSTHELEEIYDASLAQNARILFGLLQQEVKEGELELLSDIELNSDRMHAYELNIAFWASIGKVTIQSSGAPEFLTALPDGFSDYTFNGSKWRVFTLRDRETDLVIHTAQKLEAREELVAYLIKDTLSVNILILPVMGLLIWWGISSSLKPLKQLVDEAGAMDSHSLRPFNIEDAPSEVSPLITALNQLLERLNLAIENERRFTSDAAHELRTPLAGLKVQLQVALRADDPQQKANAMKKAVEGIDRATHLVNQLLTLARADREDAGTLVMGRVDLVSLSENILSTMKAEALQLGIKLNFTTDQRSIYVECEPTMIEIALRNLLENALRYTAPPAQAGIDLTRSSTSGEVILSVWDTGKGIPPEAVAQMFQRFKRGSDNSASGSGLGLSIVQRIGDIHNAQVSVNPASKTTKFSISLRFKTAR